MITNNIIEKSFGPIGTSVGIIFLIAGLISTICFSLTGLILVVIGAFIGFSSTCTLIDPDKRKVKLSNNLFGIIKTGQWINIQSDMKIGIKKSNKMWRAYSRSNRTLDIADNDFRVILYDSNKKQIMPLKKTDSLSSAKVELEKLSNQLGLGTI